MRNCSKSLLKFDGGSSPSCAWAIIIRAASSPLLRNSLIYKIQGNTLHTFLSPGDTTNY